jgi:DNA-binding transcriptional ArsR family regulator
VDRARKTLHLFSNWSGKNLPLHDKRPTQKMTPVIFIFTNMTYNQAMTAKKKVLAVADRISAILQVVSSPARIAILLSIGHGEACVCHLEAALGWRQAYISQHLMALRKAEILVDRRDGRYVYYRLADASLLELVLATAQLGGLDREAIAPLINTQKNPSCECPQCMSKSILPKAP